MKHLFIAACCCLASAGFAAEPFEIRGVLPWHNFLCGPTAWNKADYEVYLDNCEAEGINFIGFHNYTGGGERYATYVEPMVRISYRGIVPQAMLDNSLSCRWGALPLRLKEFAFGSQRALDVPRGAEAFGSDCSLISKTPDEHYRNTQRLMRDVLRMAHDRDIEMAMGFEFGVVPPEYFSLYAAGSCFFWLGAGNMVPNPCHPTSVELHRAALDDLLENYPDIDYVWLWLNEHSFLGVVVEQALGDPAFAEVFRRESGHFEEAQSDSERFVGVWSLEFLADIARHRKVWAVPWLEGDNQMWHQQPRVGKMRDHVQLAREQGLQGVAAIHWRTAETRYNFRTFARYARTSDDATVETLYKEYFEEDFGAQAAAALAPLMAAVDTANAWEGPQSPEYFAFRPDWGVLDEANAASRQGIIDAIDAVQDKEQTPQQRRNLKSFRAMLSFELLLDKVVRAMAPGWELRDKTLAENRPASREACAAALRELESAPVEELIRTYVSRTGSRGEMGILTSINQRLWNNYLLLKNYLQENTH